MGVTSLVVLLMIAGCSACAAGPDYIAGDPSFTTSERADIERGTRWLAEHTSTYIPEIRWQHPSMGTRYLLRSDLPVGTLGTSSETCIMIDVYQAWDRVDVVAAHELAHALGMSHHEASGLMHRDVPLTLSWSAADQAECERRDVCKH